MAKPKPHARPLLLMILLAAMFFVLFMSLNTQRHRSMFSFEWGDEAVHNQLAWRTFRYGMFSSTLKGDQVFDQHFRPIWILPAFLYLLIPGIHAWFIVLIGALAGASIVLFFWAYRRLGDPWAALGFGAVFLFYPPIHMLALGVYDPEKLAVLFLLLTMYADQQKRFGLFLLFAALSLACKEIVGFTLVMIAVEMAVRRQPAKYWGGLFTLAVAWMALAFFVIIPATIQGDYGSKYFPQLLGADCESVGCLLSHTLGHPWDSFQVFFSYEHVRILFLLLVPLMGMSLLSPVLLIPATASLTMILAVPGPLLVNQHHWITPAIPPIFLAAVAGTERLSKWIGKSNAGKAMLVRRFVPLLMLGSCVMLTIYGGLVGRFHGDAIDDEYYRGLSNVFDHRIYEVSPRDRIAWELIGRIPKDAKVTTNYQLMPALSNREYVREFGRIEKGYDSFDFDYILISLQDRYFGAGHDVRLTPENLERLAELVEKGVVKPVYVDENHFLGMRLPPEKQPKVIDKESAARIVECLIILRQAEERAAKALSRADVKAIQGDK